MQQPIVLITRPQEDALPLADAIRNIAPGVRTIVSPLQQILFANTLPDPGPDLRLIFTSRNGVRAWNSVGGPPRIAYCVGDATQELAISAGHDTVSAGGDVEDLYNLLIEESPEAPLLHLRGRVHRGNLAGRLTAAGMRAAAVDSYQQVPRPFTQAARAAMQGTDPVIAPLYSERTARLFAENWTGSAPLYIAAMSDHVAESLKNMSFQDLVIADQPTGTAMLDVTAGLARRVQQLETGGGHV